MFWHIIRGSLALLTAFMASGATASEGDSLWSRTYGGRLFEHAYTIIPSAENEFIMGGSTTSYGSVGRDAWLVYVKENGDSLWSRKYGGNGHEHINAIVPSGDGGFMAAGYTTSFGAGGLDMYLLKFDAAGERIWHRTYGGDNDDEALALAPDGKGGFLLAGYSESFGNGFPDVWLLQVDSAGDSLWSLTYGNIGVDYAAAILHQGGGAFRVAGTSVMETGAATALVLDVNAGENAVTAHTYQAGSGNLMATCLLPAPDGGYLLGGYAGLPFTPADAYLARMDGKGQLLWSHTYGGPDEEIFSTMAATGDGGYLLAGFTQAPGPSNLDMYLVRVNARGEFLWQNSYGGSRDDRAYCLIPDGDGHYFLAGHTGSYGSGWADFWLVCLDATPEAGVPVGKEVLRRGDGVLGRGESPETEPPATRMLGPSPNPFNPTTAVGYQLPAPGYVSLRIYDTAGREVSALVDGWRDAGSHRVTFDGSDLAAGVYLARMEAGDFVQVQKLILLK